MSAPVRRRRALRGAGDLLREEIIAEAEKLLVETDSEELVSVRAIAQRVGVTTPSIYLHFADKQALLDTVCERVFGSMDEQMERACAGVAEPFEALRRRGMAYVEFGLRHPEHYRIIMLRRPLPDADAGSTDLAVASSAFGHLVEAVSRCVDAGVFGAGEDPRSLALVLWAAAHGITSLLITKPLFPWPSDLEAVADLVIRTAGLGLVLRAEIAAGRWAPQMPAEG